MSLWGAVQHFGAESEYQKQARDPQQIAAQAARLEGIRAAAPENAVLGYLTDVDLNAVAGQVMFNAAQYVLAPRLIRHDAESDWALGNFTRPADFAAAGRAHGLRVERDFGNGVVLFRREGGK
jgi:hypothetical protein